MPSEPVTQDNCSTDHIADDFSFMDEPEHTCPLIDGVLKQLTSFEQTLNGRVRDDEFESKLEEARDEFDMFYLDKQMEEIRSANHALREWGSEYRAAFKRLNTKCEQLEHEKEQLALRLQQLTVTSKQETDHAHD